MALAGLADLVVLVVNVRDHDIFISELDDYALPVLQDSTETNVFEAWGTTDKDAFVLDRAGALVQAWHGLNPVQDQERLVAVLETFL